MQTTDADTDKKSLRISKRKPKYKGSTKKSKSHKAPWLLE